MLGFDNYAPPSGDYSGLRAWDSWAYSASVDDYPALNWNGMHPADGVFNFDVLDAYKDFLVTNDKQAVLTLAKYAGTWLDGTDAEVKARWASFIAALLPELAGSNINAVELWNEPNGVNNGLTPALAYELAAIAYPLIKAAYPAMTVLSPAPQGNGAGWFGDLLALGGAAYFDVIALHLYCDPDPSAAAVDGGLLACLDAYKEVFATYGISQRDVWVTEFSEHGYWFTGELSATNERDYIGQMLPMLAGMKGRLGNRFSRLYWYAWDSTATGTLWTQADGPNEAAEAWTQVRGWLLDAEVSPVVFNGGVGQVTLRRAGYTGKVVWHYLGSSDFAVPAGLFTRYRDLAGNIVAIDGAATSVPITNSAILLETA